MATIKDKIESVVKSLIDDVNDAHKDYHEEKISSQIKKDRIDVSTDTALFRLERDVNNEIAEVTKELTKRR